MSYFPTSTIPNFEEKYVMETITTTSKFATLLKASEFNRFGLICVVLTIVGCLGGVAVGLGAITSTLALTFIVIPTMLTLSMILGVAPMKYILGGVSLAVLIDTILIVYYLM